MGSELLPHVTGIIVDIFQPYFKCHLKNVLRMAQSEENIILHTDNDRQQEDDEVMLIETSNASSNEAEAQCDPLVADAQQTENRRDEVSNKPVHHDNEEDQHCPICFDSWSNSGSHRIVSLRCGHLFGQSCIERWLRGREQRCPQCNEKSSVRDIRTVYAKCVSVVDTSERDRAIKDLEQQKEIRRKLELEHSIVKLKCRMQETEIGRLQKELAALRRLVGDDSVARSCGTSSAAQCCVQNSSTSDEWSLSLDTTLSISRSGGCRVMQFNSWLGMLVVSQPSQNALFPGHGVRKVNVLDRRAMQFVSLHQKQLRDLEFHCEQRDLLLSVALDGRALLTNMTSGARVLGWQCGVPCWSCTWDASNQHQCYVGLSSGVVLAYDTRRDDQPLCRLEVGGSVAGPVVGLCHVAGEGVDALVVCRLSACSVLTFPTRHSTAASGSGEEHSLPLVGPFTSLSLDRHTGHLLVSARPSARAPHATHAVCQLSAPDSSDSGVNVVRTLQGDTSQRLMSRAALLPSPEDSSRLLAAAGLETAGAVHLWDVASGQCRYKLPASEPVLDVCSLHHQHSQMTALLNERQLRIYSWHQKS